MSWRSTFQTTNYCVCTSFTNLAAFFAWELLGAGLKLRASAPTLQLDSRIHSLADLFRHLEDGKLRFTFEPDAVDYEFLRRLSKADKDRLLDLAVTTKTGNYLDVINQGGDWVILVDDEKAWRLCYHKNKCFDLALSEITRSRVTYKLIKPAVPAGPNSEALPILSRQHGHLAPRRAGLLFLAR